MFYHKIKKIAEIFFIYFRLYELKIEKTTFLSFKLDSNFEFRILNENDIIFFQNFNLPKRYIDIYINRFKNKTYKCFAVFDKNTSKLVYYSWINFEKKTYCRELKRNLYLKEKNACLFEDDNTHLDYRKNKLHTFIMNERIKFCKSLNLERIYIIIHPNNIPAIKTINKFNFVKTFHIPIKFRENTLHLLSNKITSIWKN